MIKMLTKWFDRKPTALPHVKPRDEVGLPDNIEEYYLATLYLMQDDMRVGSAKDNYHTFDQLYRIMTKKLNAGTWHPSATLEDRPKEYWLNKKHQKWESLVFHNEQWFREAMSQLIEITSNYIKTNKDTELQAVELRYKGIGDKIPTSTRQELIEGRDRTMRSFTLQKIIRYAYIEIAAGFCGYIEIETTSNRSNSFIEYEPCCLSLEFQGEHWEFNCPTGFFNENEQVEISINGRAFYEGDDLPIIKQYQIKMMKVIAEHSIKMWQRTRLLAWLEAQPVIKESAQTLSKWIDGCYHKHMTEIYQITQRPFDPRDIVNYYTCFYRTDVFHSALIRDLYKDIYEGLADKAS